MSMDNNTTQNRLVSVIHQRGGTSEGELLNLTPDYYKRVYISSIKPAFSLSRTVTGADGAPTASSDWENLTGYNEVLGYVKLAGGVTDATLLIWTVDRDNSNNLIISGQTTALVSGQEFLFQNIRGREFYIQVSAITGSYGSVEIYAARV